MSKALETSLERMARGRIVFAEAEFTRPNNTTQYASGDLIHSGLSLATVAPLTFTLPDWTRGLGGNLHRVLLAKSGNTTSSANYLMFVWLAPPTVINAVDNTPYNTQILSWTDRDKFLSTVSVSSLSAGVTGGGASALSSVLNIQFPPLLHNNSFYGVLTLSAGYTPIANEQYYIKMYIAFP